MTSKTKTEIKAFFQTGDSPTEAQFIDLIDSFVDKSGPLGTLETDVSAGTTGFVYASAGDAEIVNASNTLSRLGVTVYTTALSQSVVPYATTADANTGTATGLVMDPVLTRNAIETFSFTSANFASTAQANTGTNDGKLMTPVLVKNAIGALGGAAAGLTLIGTLTPTGVATASFSSIAQTYRALVGYWSGVSSDTATRSLLVKATTGGSDTAARYTNVSTTTLTTESQIYFSKGTDQAAAAVRAGTFIIHGYQAGPYKSYQAQNGSTDRAIGMIEETGAIDGITFYWNGSGNFDAGTITLYGVN